MEGMDHLARKTGMHFNSGEEDYKPFEALP